MTEPFLTRSDFRSELAYLVYLNQMSEMFAETFKARRVIFTESLRGKRPSDFLREQT